MLPTVSSIPCQVDGLLRIYTYAESSAFFEFENQEKLQKAKDAFTSRIMNNSTLYLNSVIPEHTEFVFGVSTDNPIKSIGQLICRVIEVISTETSLKKDIPIRPITIECLIYKG